MAAQTSARAYSKSVQKNEWSGSRWAATDEAPRSDDCQNPTDASKPASDNKSDACEDACDKAADGRTSRFVHLLRDVGVVVAHYVAEAQQSWREKESRPAHTTHSTATGCEQLVDT